MLPRSPRKLSWWLWPVAAAVLVVAAAAFLGLRYRQDSPPLQPVRFDIQPPPGSRFDAPFLSPDGTSVAVFVETPQRPERPSLWLYSLQSNRARQLFEPNERGRRHVIWSPDGTAVAVFADGHLKRIDIASGSIQNLCATGGKFVSGGSWSGDTILFSDDQKLKRVAAVGGTPVTVTALDPSREESGHFFPEFLPDGRHFIYLRASATSDNSGIYLGSLDAAPDAQNVTRLVPTRSNAVYMPATGRRSGHLLFMRDSTLMAQAFDSRRLLPVGEPFPIDQPIARDVSVSDRYGYFSASDTGALTLIRDQPMQGVLVWVDRRGSERGSVLAQPQEAPQQPRVSPDGTRLALIVAGDLWVFDLGEKPPIRLTFDGSNEFPLWTPDGRRLVYAREAPPMGLRWIVAHSSNQLPWPRSPEGHYHPHGWSPNGRELIAVVNTYDARFAWDVMKLLWPPGGGLEPEPVVRSPFVEGMGGASLSPDGRWLAYTSNRTGDHEVWLEPYPGPGEAVRVSVNGGWNPVWARDGRELYYVDGDQMMAAMIGVGPTPIRRPPARLFKSSYAYPPGMVPSWDVAPNGQFVMIKPVEKAAPSPAITVILNWAPGVTP